MFDRMSPNINMQNSVKVCKYQDDCRDYNRLCAFCDNNELNQKKSYFKQTVQTNGLWRTHYDY